MFCVSLRNELSVRHISVQFIPIQTIQTPLLSVPQPRGAAGQGPAGRLLPPLPRLLRSDHLAAGLQGHRGAGMGFHVPLVPLQVPVEAHGEGHAQHLQVRRTKICSSVTRCFTLTLPQVFGCLESLWVADKDYFLPIRLYVT